MNDFREDLVERLKALDDERMQHVKRLEEINDEEKLYRQTLVVENRRWSDSQPELPIEVEENQLSGFIEIVLRAGPLNFEEIRDRVTRTDLTVKSASPGRSVQAVLAGFAKQRLIQKTDSGQWKWVDVSGGSTALARALGDSLEGPSVEGIKKHAANINETP